MNCLIVSGDDPFFYFSGENHRDNQLVDHPTRLFCFVERDTKERAAEGQTLKRQFLQKRSSK